MTPGHPPDGTWLERLVDRVVCLGRPRQAAIRAHFRAMEHSRDYRELVLTTMRARGYRAAKQSTNQTPFSGGSGSADAEITNDLPTLRNRSRELNRDDPLASGLTGTFVNNIVGTGLWPQPRALRPDGTMDEAKCAAITRTWWRLADNLYRADRLTHAAAQRLRLRKVLEDGEIFRKSVKSPSDPADPVWFETIEADRVATPRDRTGMVSGGEIRDGIERDIRGVPVAVWVSRGYPGDGLIGAGARQFERVPFPIIAQIGSKERPGQTRCVPIFHAILQDLRDLDLLLLASLKRVQISACMALFIKSNKAADDLLELTAEQYGYKLDQSIEPGMIFKLYPDEEIQTVIPNFQGAELAPFVVLLCRRIGAALGVSWQVVLRDFSESTYSSARTDKMDAYQTWDAIQYLFIEQDLVPEWREVMTDAILRREPELVAAGVGPADIEDVEWIPNGRPWIDPLKEAQANQVALEMGITSPTEICAKLGKDYRAVRLQALQDEKWEADQRALLGLPARPAAVKPGLPFRPAGEGEDAEEVPPPRRGILSLTRRTG